MAAVPITLVCMVYPRDKSIEPYPATLQGYANITGLDVGGGPIIPPEGVDPPQPPLVIWGPPGPWVGWPADPGIPGSGPPDLPPDTQPPSPVKPHEGWNWSAAKSGWYYLYVPREGDPTPKRK